MKSKVIEQWLAPLDGAAMECDGFSRVVSTLLHRDAIPHKMIAGSLDVHGVGRIPVHFWIAFDDGSVCDFRARMWLGDVEAVPHGVFLPSEGQTYNAGEVINTSPLSASVFHVLAGREQSSFAVISDFE